jgi:hypothetical protein
VFTTENTGAQSFEELFEAVEGEATTDLIPLVDASIGRVTLYPRITLGGEGPAAAVTGVFVPKAITGASRIDAIVYLHGHHRGGSYPTDLNIFDYWDASRYPHFRLRQVLQATGQPFVLVAPTLGPRSQAGWLTEAGGFDRYMQRVRQELISGNYGVLPNATWGRIILACHSGGGSPMRKIATGTDALAANITQCWGFDCLYSDADEPAWLQWVGLGGRQLYIYYGDGGTATRSLNLARQAHQQWLNIHVGGSTALEHNKVPIAFWRERLLAL